MTTYREVNAAWPGERYPVPTPQEALRGTRRLIRKAHSLAIADGVIPKHASKPRYWTKDLQLTSGNRHTNIWRGVVNPNENNFYGWHEIVHSVSHWAQRHYWGGESHGPRHVWIEKELVDYAVANFLDCQLKSRAKPKPLTNKTDVRAQRVASGIKRWEAKIRRAQNALRKLRRQERYYARRSEHPDVPRPIDTGEPGAMGGGASKLAA